MEALQITWFILIAVLLTIYAILDGFDLGSGFWTLFTKEDNHKKSIINAIAPFWDGNEVWLLTGGGAIFAAFSPVYATTFSSFYLAIILVIFGLASRAMSIEYRGGVESPKWKKIWDISLGVGSILPALLYGVALGNVVRGLPMDNLGNYTGTFFDLLNPYSLLIGVTGLVMFIYHGANYLSMKVEGDFAEISRKRAIKVWPIYIILILASVIWTTVVYGASSTTPAITIAIFAIIVAAISLRCNLKGNRIRAFIMSSAMTLLNMSFLAATLFPDMVRGKGGSNSLTIFNSSSSQNTLTVMLVMALIGVPIVLAYTIFIYRVFKGKVTEEPSH